MAITAAGFLGNRRTTTHHLWFLACNTASRKREHEVAEGDGELPGGRGGDGGNSPPGEQGREDLLVGECERVMRSNPGHYVAMVIASPAARTENGTPVKQLKLLRPDDTLLLGQVYRLISFEDVLKEFAAKKCVKLGKMLKERGAFNIDTKKKSGHKLQFKLINHPLLLRRSSRRGTASEAAVEVAAEAAGGTRVVEGSGGQLCILLQSLELEHQESAA
ncbi:hypothetical protein Sango_1819400 [Sesamum angolense]|uniref:Uncharacterized protein n=1 Tax=Sesamum angolense TaxID=2727404 RepID=A0AAE2BPX8_9LAMI|nr:hypothetical protein Sango_1819400 [Sesamum angolense]